MRALLQSVGEAMGIGQRHICVVCRGDEMSAVISHLETLGELPKEIDDEDQGSGIWGLLQARAYVVTWGCSTMGRRFDRIILVNRRQAESLYRDDLIANWLSTSVQTRLLAGGDLDEVQV